MVRENKESEVDQYPARVSRSATLDGGAVIVHSGFSHGDRTIKIIATVSEDDAETLLNIHQTETLVCISIKDGFYLGAIELLDINGGQVKMTFLIQEKLS